VSDESLVGFINRLGYDPDTLHLEGITTPVVNLKDIYRQLPSRPDVAARIEKVIGSSTDATNTAYLADIAALVTESPKWCLRIPEDLPMASRWRFRDWCVFTVASNSGNVALCRLIPIATGDPRLSLQRQREAQARSPHPKGRYGPEVPDTDDRMRTLITMLGYEIPRAKDLPVKTLSAAYARFLDELNRGNDAQHAAARKRLIARVRALAAHRS